MNVQTSSEVRLRVLLWLAVAVSFFLNIHAVPLFDVDEGAFSEATREMFERGDFISTYLNGEPRYDKPILIYWLQAASVAVFGVNEFAFRLPSALAACGWVYAVFWFMRRVRNIKLAYDAALVTALSLAVSVIAKAATADALLNLWIVLSMFAVYLYYKERKQRFIFLAYAAMGLGFLTKGPVAVLVPGVVSLVFFALRRDLGAWLRAVLHPGGIALFLLIALPWYVLQYQKEGQAFIDGFFFKHNIDRFSGEMEQHGGSLFYYVPVALVGVLPFTAVVFKLIARWREIVRDELMLYCALWFGFVFVFFSLSGTKLPHYMNYGMTGLVILVALYLHELRSRWLAMLPPVLWFALLAFLPALFAALAQREKDAYFAEVLGAAPTGFGGLYHGVVWLCLGASIVLMFTTRLVPRQKLLASGFLAATAISGVLFPAIGAVVQEPVREAALLARANGYAVVMWRVNLPSFSVYAQRVTPRRRPQPGEVVLTKTKHLDELPAHDVLMSRNGIALARLHP
jgi:4-amino-4-deoxy-L-arabinose transferase-like glycosyltransferase